VLGQLNRQGISLNSFVRWGSLCVWLLVAQGCQPRNKYAAPPPPKVTVALPVKEPVQVYFETTGQTRAVQQVDLQARVGGYLKKINFKDGEMVKAGDVLFEIDQDTYLAAVESAKASLKRADAQLRLADQQLLRTRDLAKEDAATQSALDIQTADRDSREADVDAAKAALREAELNLSYTLITAPFSGRMGRHLVDIGNLIIAGQTMLGSLESVDPIHAYFTVSESDLLNFMEMQKAGRLKPITEADPLRLDLALGDTQDYRFHGQLDFRKFGINPATGTTERRAVFPNDPPDLLPGLFVRIRAAVGDPHPYLLVDEQALGRDQRGDFLLVVNKKNIVETRPVKLGPMNAGLQAIESGITETDHVIIQGVQRARPGAEVQPELVAMDSLIKAREGSADQQQNEDQSADEKSDSAATQMRSEEKGPANEEAAEKNTPAETSPDLEPRKKRSSDSATSSGPGNSSTPSSPVKQQKSR